MKILILSQVIGRFRYSAFKLSSADHVATYLFFEKLKGSILFIWYVKVYPPRCQDYKFLESLITKSLGL